MKTVNDLVKLVWLVEKYEEEGVYVGYVFDPHGYLLMPNGMVYDLNSKYNREGELELIAKDTIVVYSLEELFEKCPEAVTWDYINSL